MKKCCSSLKSCQSTSSQHSGLLDLSSEQALVQTSRAPAFLPRFTHRVLHTKTRSCIRSNGTHLFARIIQNQDTPGTTKSLLFFLERNLTHLLFHNITISSLNMHITHKKLRTIREITTIKEGFVSCSYLVFISKMMWTQTKAFLVIRKWIRTICLLFLWRLRVEFTLQSFPELGAEDFSPYPACCMCRTSK